MNRTDTESEAQPELEQDAESDLDTESGVEPDPGVESGTASDVGSHSEAEQGADTGAPGAAWSISPANNEHGSARTSFDYELGAGDTVEDELEVSNDGTEPMTLWVYGADGTTTPAGEFDLQPAHAPRTELGDWVTLDEPVASDGLTLDPGESGVVDFTVDVPDEVATGEHLGGIVTSLPPDAGAEQTVAVDYRVATMVTVTVEGEQDTADEGLGLGAWSGMIVATLALVALIVSVIRLKRSKAESKVEGEIAQDSGSDDETDVSNDPVAGPGSDENNTDDSDPESTDQDSGSTK